MGWASTTCFRFSSPFRCSRAHRAAIEEARAEAASLVTADRRLDVRYGVRTAYADVWEWDRIIEVTEKTRALAGASARLAVRRYGAGATGQGDVLRTDAERAGYDAALAVARENRDAASARLIAALGLSPADAPAVPAIADLPEPVLDTPVETLIAAALDGRPEPAVARSRVREAEASLKAAKSQYVPNATVTAGYMLSTMETDAYNAMLGLSVPLWPTWRSRAKAQARAEVQAGHRDEAFARLTIEKEVREALAGFRAARISHQILARDVEPRAEGAYEAIAAGYAAGSESLAALIDAQQALYDARLQVRRARADAFRRWAALRRAVGEDS
ncbi:MAG: TolC family protein [Deltaproteobacteria bacterium]|nr:TolC family protein [Deltaproteobacteria bacterium]